jgi:D-glycero-D-manno-heptose 1,7-bisphosphate phosphatase
MTGRPGRPAVFLDRDGVLNEAYVRDGVPVPPRDVSEFRLLPGVEDACTALKKSGFALVVITNQPDIARGKQTHAEVDRIHDRLRSLLPVDEICVCPHDDADDCSCRKPRPGMLLDAAVRLGLDLARSASVGDRWRDVEAANRAGVASIYVKGSHGQTSDPEPTGAHVVVADLPEAAAWIQLQDWAPEGMR